MSDVNAMCSKERDMAGRQLHPVFTAYKTADTILNTYRRKLKERCIPFYVDGSSIVKTKLPDDAFAEILNLALQLAFETVLGQQNLQKRYIRMSTMNAQKKLFIKLEYAGKWEESVNSEQYRRLENLLTSHDYLELKCKGNQNQLLIAIRLEN